MLRSSHRPSLASESPIHHIALIVDDLNKTEEFYGTVLGLPIEKRWTFPDGSPRSVWLSLGSNTRLMLEKKTPSCVKLNKPESTRLTQHHTQQNTPVRFTRLLRDCCKTVKIVLCSVHSLLLLPLL